MKRDQENVLVAVVVLAVLALLVPSATAIGFGSDQTPKFGAARRNLPAVVVESHHQVLKFWLRAKALPNDGIAVVHFDSHPDMGIPKFIPRRLPKRASWIEDEEKVDIASFQLAAVWIGLVNEIVWVKPPWSKQIPDILEPRTMYFGVQNASDPRGRRRFRISATEDYWLANNYATEAHKIQRPRKFTFRVIPFSMLKDVKQLVKSKYAILDIDMDFFATKNTGVLTFEEKCNHTVIEDLRAAWDLENLCTSNTNYTVRQQTYNNATDSLGSLAKGKMYNTTLEEFKALNEGLYLAWCPDKREDLLVRYWRVVREINDTEYLKEMASHMHGAANLPLHMGSPEEIRHMVEDMRTALEFHAETFYPKLITMARSVEDEFTPVLHWPLIEWSLMEGLKDLYTNVTARYDVGLVKPPSPTGAIEDAQIVQDYLGNMSPEGPYDRNWH